MGTELQSYRARMAEIGRKYAEQERQGTGTFLSTRGGILSFKGQPLPGNQLVCVLMDSLIEYAYYTSAWDAENITPPLCYAAGHDENAMAPHIETMKLHPDVFVPQAKTCAQCEYSKFGSSTTGSKKGRACKETRRLALLPGGVYRPSSNGGFDCHLFDDAEHFRTCDAAYLKVPPTSIRNLKQYVQETTKNYGAPSAVYTRIAAQPHSKNSFELVFQAIDTLSDDVGIVVLDRWAEFYDAPYAGFTPSAD